MEPIQMEEENLLQNSGVVHRIRSCILAKNASHGFVRGFIMGTFITITIAQISAYNILSATVQHGQLPWFVTDVVIVSIGAMEVILSPVLGWFGYRRRRTVMLVMLVVTGVSTLMLLAVPDIDTHEATGFCMPGAVNIIHSSSTSLKAYLRLSLVTVYGLVCSLTMVTIWSHGIAYLEEHNTDGMSMHYGILIGIRVIALAAFPKVLHSMKAWLQVLAILGPLTIHLVQLLKMPEVAPPAEGVLVTPFDKRGLMRSLRRVISSGLVVSQLLTMALLTAALWGFGYHEQELVKVLYGLTYSDDWRGTSADMLRYHLVILFVIFFARRFSRPTMMVFNKVSAVQFSTRFCLVVPLTYIIMTTVLGCNRGVTAGLTSLQYQPPICSALCGCFNQLIEYNPVCVVDDMTTYLSPCFAGCTLTQEYSGITALANCTCGVDSGRAVLGSCSNGNCFLGFELHKLQFLLCIIFNVLIFKSQGICVLREVDPRDRSAALGLMSAVVALFTFVIGHSAYFLIRYLTCAWSVDGVCLLHNSRFPLLLGVTSASLTVTAAIISIITNIILVRREK